MIKKSEDSSPRSVSSEHSDNDQKLKIPIKYKNGSDRVLLSPNTADRSSLDDLFNSKNANKIHIEQVECNGPNDSGSVNPFDDGRKLLKTTFSEIQDLRNIDEENVEEEEVIDKDKLSKLITDAVRKR